MKIFKNNPNRSWFTTFFASILGLAILGFSLLLLPISNFAEGASFFVAILLVIICAITAYDGKKGRVAELINDLLNWR